MSIFAIIEISALVDNKAERRLERAEEMLLGEDQLKLFNFTSSKNTSSSSSSSSICSPERSPQLLRRQERRTRSWQGRQQRHRSRQNIREQDRLLVDSLTRRIQPMLLEGRAAEVKTLLLHALAKPSTRERALRLIGYVSDALSSSWSVQVCVIVTWTILLQKTQTFIS
ncbi:unnamed protein product [Dibothriocephalus latus]|uniref:Uncharacterized protein n=1 Tax=Dibothriocephalus latus TaxID=60516 RepID=A0A3P7P7T0_DIBLA|nr:unnamed protein product [Dibothriocephalus latus]